MSTPSPRQAAARTDLEPWPQLLVAGVVAAVPIIVLAALHAHGGDEPAQLYRSFLAGRGVLLWDNYWYGGQLLPAYSVLYPAVAAAIGNVLLVSIGGVAAAVLYASVVIRTFGASARWSAYLFALTACSPLLTGEYPYSLGMTALLATLWALTRGWRWAAVVGATLSWAFSPLAGAFLVLTLAALAVHRRRDWRRWWAVAVGVAVVSVGAVLVQLAFPLAGSLSFPAATLREALRALAAAALVLWPGERTRWLAGLVALWAVTCVLAYEVSTPVGYNVTRAETWLLPLALLAAPSLRRWRLLLLAPALATGLLLALVPFRAALPHAGRGRTAQAAFWAPARTFLAEHRSADYRVEVVPTYGHWEAYFLGSSFPLARGWYRQLDVARNRVLYGRLTSRSYVSWLRANGIRYVLLPPGHVDGQSEARLLRSGRSGLRRAFSSRGWSGYLLADPTPLLTGPHAASLTSLGHAVVAGEVRGPGTYGLAGKLRPFGRDRSLVLCYGGDRGVGGVRGGVRVGVCWCAGRGGSDSR